MREATWTNADDVIEAHLVCEAPAADVRRYLLNLPPVISVDPATGMVVAQWPTTGTVMFAFDGSRFT